MSAPPVRVGHRYGRAAVQPAAMGTEIDGEVLATVAVKTSLGGASLVEVLDRILEKGIVIDLWAKVLLVGIELLGVEARVVIASVDTWLRYAKAVGLLVYPHEEAA